MVSNEKNLDPSAGSLSIHSNLFIDRFAGVQFGALSVANPNPHCDQHVHADRDAHPNEYAEADENGNFHNDVSACAVAFSLRLAKIIFRLI